MKNRKFYVGVCVYACIEQKERKKEKEQAK